jgi:hypothetical protein
MFWAPSPGMYVLYLSLPSGFSKPATFCTVNLVPFMWRGGSDEALRWSCARLSLREAHERIGANLGSARARATGLAVADFQQLTDAALALVQPSTRVRSTVLLL